MAFIITGALGFIWLLFWIPMYRKPELQKRLTETERNYILQDEQEPETTKLHWKSIITYKQTWGICLARVFNRSDLVVLSVLAT